MDLASSLQFVAVALVFYIVYGAVYRLYFSPIASFPGPKLAALTFWYEFYYDVVRRGRYTWKIAELHKKYGPIVRINPREIHIIDPDFIDELYVGASKRKTDLWSWTVPMLGTPNSILATVDHDLHRRRRNAYATFFSKQSIRNYSSVIQAAVDKLCLRLRESSKFGKPVNLLHTYSAMTGDIVTGYCFPESYGLLDKPDYGAEIYELFASTLANVHILKHFPLLLPLLLALPEWLVQFLVPDFATTFRWQREWVRQINAIKSGADDEKDRAGTPSIFQTLLDADLPPYDKSASRLMEDAQTLLGGGSVTTSMALALATYYILSDDHVLRTLTDELATAIPDPAHPLPLVELEKLEYLTATTFETLRISHGVSHRLQRVSPDQSLRYHDWIIPAGTPVSMTSVHIHNNVDIFPEPHLFKPERWLPLETEGRRLQKYLIAFSRGSRQCLGMNLGSAELYLGLAGVFRTLGHSMRVVDTVKERDVDICRDIFTPAMREDTTGIKVVIGE